MTVQILIPDELTRYSNGQRQINVDGGTIAESLQNLFHKFPQLQIRLVDENWHFYPYVPAFLNNEKLPLQGAINRRLQDQDQLTFMVIASGG